MVFRRLPILLLLAFLIFPTVCIALTETIGRAEDRQRSNFSFAGEPVPLGRPDVYESLDQELLLLSEAKARVWLTLRRSPRYLPIIGSALTNAGVPQDFRFLPMALANLDPHYRSGGSGGFWRLSEPYAAGLGLTVNKLLDQRMDPEASSVAAATRIASLSKSYGGWTMALAAFLDEGGLAQAVQESGGVADYYSLYVNENLQKSVSQVLAGKILYSSPQSYGYNLSKAWPPIGRRVQVAGEGRMGKIAADNGVDYKSLRDLNPHVRTDVVPSGTTIYLP
jgi:hypothetical protein